MRNRRRHTIRGSLLLAAVVMLAAAAWVPWPQRPAGPPAGLHDIARQSPLATVPLQLPAADLEAEAPARPQPPGWPGGAPMAADPAMPWHHDTPPPDPELPVAELLEQLLDRARAGDVLASCELGRGLDACGRYLRGSRVRNLPPPGPGATPQQRELHAWHLRMERRCGGITVDDLALAPSLLVRAAQAGHVPSLLDFVHAPHTEPAEFLLDPELGRFYRSQVWPLLRRAVAAGHADAGLLLMQQIASAHRTPLVAMLPDGYRDPVAARALIAHMARGMPAAQRPEYPPASERSGATAARWVDELFGGAVPSVASLTRHDEPGTVVPSQCRDAPAWALP